MEIIILFVVLFVVCLLITKSDNDALQFIGLFGAFISLLIITVICVCYISSNKEAKYMNKKFGTNYTTEEVFWNGNLIKSELKIDDKIIDNSSKIKVEVKNK